MDLLTRRGFLQHSGAMLAGGALLSEALAQMPGERPTQSPEVKILNPQGRVPVSLIIDDSTCLVNLAHFAIPQFAQVFPDRYKQDWRKLPREIPDAFVRKFLDWCRDKGVKGKYSIVPYPACVGWMDRDLPGWSRKALEDSLDLVRKEVAPDWDIHPEMVSHTWVIDTKTGRPYSERSERFMENWRWTDGKSVDQLADYLAYAQRILKNVGLPCTGITTPGGFGNRVLPELAQATLQSCRDVFQEEIPHYFRHLYTDNRSVVPQVYYASGLDGDDPRCVVSIIGCTGDWFGGWDGLEIGKTDQFLTADLSSGRLKEVIDKQEPAILVCHWPGIYCNGDETGFNIFKEVVDRMHQAYSHLKWMKLSEIARYWAAKELTTIKPGGDVAWTLKAPFACPGFTLEIPAKSNRVIVQHGPETVELKLINDAKALTPGTVLRVGDRWQACWDLKKGATALQG